MGKQITLEFAASLKSVVNSYGRKIDHWDDGIGPLWVYQDTGGVRGIVRAQTWEDAYSCVEDEIMDDADMSDPDNAPDADGNLPEGLHYRGCGVPSNPRLKSNVASEDLNGSALEPLTLENVRDWDLIITIEDDDRTTII